MPRVSLILFTLRDQCKEDLPGTLAMVREVGYEHVQVSGVGRYEPSSMAASLRDAGLGASSCHVSMEELDTEMPWVLESCDAIGMNRVVMPFTKARSRAECAELVEKLEHHAATLKHHNIELGYHNHDFEFAAFDDGEDGPDNLWEMVAASSLFLEPDLGWVWYAERDPQAMLNDLAAAGRCPLVHLKDFEDRSPDRTFCPVGDGGVGFGDIVASPAAKQVEELIVEQDHLRGMGPREAVERSLRTVRAALGTT
ncbi:MAG: TIM barrel protein [Planctomycetota bacterium]